MAKKGEQKDRSDVIRKKKKDENEEKLEDKFAPLKVAHTVQEQIRDFKVNFSFFIAKQQLDLFWLIVAKTNDCGI